MISTALCAANARGLENTDLSSGRDSNHIKKMIKDIGTINIVKAL